MLRIHPEDDACGVYPSYLWLTCVGVPCDWPLGEGISMCHTKTPPSQSSSRLLKGQIMTYMDVLMKSHN